MGGFAIVIVGDAGTESGDKVDLGFWSLDPDPVLVHDTHSAAPRMAKLLGMKGGDVAAGERLLLEPGAIGRAELERELASMRASLSWRVTAPLRRLRGLDRRSGG